MSEEKFDFINDDEIEQVLGKQEDGNSEIDDILKEALEDENNEKISEGLLEDLLSYRKNSMEDEYDYEEEREEILISAMEFREFLDNEEIEMDVAGLSLLMDVPIEISVSLGWVEMEVASLSKLHVGSKIPLKKLAGEPVEIYAGGVLIAKGETYVIDSENTFGVMITEILTERERILSAYESLKKQKQL